MASFLSSSFYHAYTAHLFVCDNIKDIICLGLLFGALNASVASEFGMGASLSFRQILVSLPQMFLWSWSNLFLFTLHNQRSASAISEDRINKPWRPLSAGRITPHQAKVLIYCMYPAIFAISGTMGGVAPCLLEAISCLWYNEWNGASSPLLKNLLNGIGFACFFAGPLEVATNSSVLSDDMKAFKWLLVLAGAITTTVHAQDFRDIDGDRATGRRTVPLLIGDGNARSALAVGIIAWTALSCWFWDVGSAERSWLSCIPACVAGTIVVWGFYWNKSREGDRRSWKIYPLWLVGLFLMPLRIL
ncbi:UbiA family prenyltransferase [Aspergillus aculeatinus CBS 121060]|uniref:Uncharacterized protein n=1 Tax=Aspergillus aculeatinus CBS 121060 TaxID=1448322 RepID=A0ACD1H3X6_9EURO|nr:hypothetical protein BO66DRAFT_377338 [Aspergillus aculeatinus CBS 121060]RAH68431.1 hypothetical protein BO66DRAFT_377338 [Aspergillus aculeatinus CBS 121060]